MVERDNFNSRASSRGSKPGFAITTRNIHRVKNSLKYVVWKGYKALATDLKVIYTTNAIESLNSVIRKSVKTRKLFPNDEAAIKVPILAIQAASKKWTMPIRNWKPAMNRFMIAF